MKQKSKWLTKYHSVQAWDTITHSRGLSCHLLSGGSKWMTTSLLFMHPNSLLSHCFERTRHLFITYGNAADESERGMHLFAFLPCATTHTHRMRPEDGLYLNTCIFNRSIINRCFAVWDAWFMRAICKRVRLHWKLESSVSIKEGTGLDCTIEQQRAYTIRSEALRLMQHYQKQIRSYAAHSHRCRLPQPPMPSQT